MSFIIVIFWDRSSKRLGVNMYLAFKKLVWLSLQKGIGDSWGQLVKVVRLGTCTVGERGGVGTGDGKLLKWIEGGVGDGGGAGSVHSSDFVIGSSGGVRVR